MSRFNYGIYYIDDLAWGDTEHLRQDTVASAYEAIRRCLDPQVRADYISIEFAHDDRVFSEISPYATWQTWENFEAQLKTHMLAHQVQLNHELTLDEGARQMLIRAHDNKRLATQPK